MCIEFEQGTAGTECSDHNLIFPDVNVTRSRSMNRCYICGVMYCGYGDMHSTYEDLYLWNGDMYRRFRKTHSKCARVSSPDRYRATRSRVGLGSGPSARACLWIRFHSAVVYPVAGHLQLCRSEGRNSCDATVSARYMGDAR
jgi:hypothetical protein